jgi:hypothetical protein
MCFGFDAILLALRAEVGAWPCDVSCKCRLFSGLIISAFLSLVVIIGPVLLFVLEPTQSFETINNTTIPPINKTIYHHNKVVTRNLFIIVYTVGTVGSLAASLIFACISKQVRQLKHIPHLISFIVWIAIVIVMYCITLKYAKWNEKFDCSKQKEGKDEFCHIKNLFIGRIIAIVLSILQFLVLVLYNFTIVDLALKHAKQCLPCL